MRWVRSQAEHAAHDGMLHSRPVALCSVRTVYPIVYLLSMQHVSKSSGYKDWPVRTDSKQGTHNAWKAVCRGRAAARGCDVVDKVLVAGSGAAARVAHRLGIEEHLHCQPESVSSMVSCEQPQEVAACCCAAS